MMFVHVKMYVRQLWLSNLVLFPYFLMHTCYVWTVKKLDYKWHVKLSRHPTDNASDYGARRPGVIMWLGVLCLH